MACRIARAVSDGQVYADPKPLVADANCLPLDRRGLLFCFWFLRVPDFAQGSLISRFFLGGREGNIDHKKKEM